MNPTVFVYVKPPFYLADIWHRNRRAKQMVEVSEWRKATEFSEVNEIEEEEDEDGYVTAESDSDCGEDEPNGEGFLQTGTFFKPKVEQLLEAPGIAEPLHLQPNTAGYLILSTQEQWPQSEMDSVEVCDKRLASVKNFSKDVWTVSKNTCTMADGSKSMCH